MLNDSKTQSDKSQKLKKDSGPTRQDGPPKSGPGEYDFTLARDVLAWEMARPNFYSTVTGLMYSKKRFSLVFDTQVKDFIPALNTEIGKGLETGQSTKVQTWDPEDGQEYLDLYRHYKRKYHKMGVKGYYHDHVAGLTAIHGGKIERRVEPFKKDTPH